MADRSGLEKRGAEGRGRVLIVDDDDGSRRVLQAILGAEGYQICEAADYASALRQLARQIPDVVITDMRMPDKGGMDVLAYVKSRCPDIPVIFLTAFGSVESAVDIMTQGAFYYFIKPPHYPSLKQTLARAVEQSRRDRDVAMAHLHHAEERGGAELLGDSLSLRDIRRIIHSVKDSNSSVLVTGETGTGKEVISRLIHFSGKRRNKPFVAVNCAAIPSNLLESELFGYEKGAFTGAVARRIGKFEEADGGTLFLDEIGEMDPQVQAKLLRVLQDKEVVRLGSNRALKIDFRLICSTNRDLAAEVAVGHFREDLFYRLNVVPIRVPPLRERPEDIPAFVRSFLAALCAREGKMHGISEEAMQVLCHYHWPGNIRQLRNVIERAVVLAPGRNIEVDDLPEQIQNDKHHPMVVTSDGHSLKNWEEAAVREALARSEGNKSRAAKELGISRKSLYKKLKDYGMFIEG